MLIKTRGLWALGPRKVTFRTRMVSHAILNLSGFRCAIGSETVKIVQFGDHIVEGLKQDKNKGLIGYVG